MRPSSNFLNVNWDMQKQTIYVDQYDGSSNLVDLSLTKQREHSIYSPKESFFDNRKNTFYSSMTNFKAKTIQEPMTP